jgi:hypothetical protein
LDAAKAALLSSYDPEEFDLSEARLVEGRFGDCWQRWSRKPNENDDQAFEPFTREQVDIARPGTHPGGNFWWVSPNGPVYVLVGVKAR